MVSQDRFQYSSGKECVDTLVGVTAFIERGHIDIVTGVLVSIRIITSFDSISKAAVTVFVCFFCAG